MIYSMLNLESINNFMLRYGSYLSLFIYVIIVYIWFSRNPWGLVTKYNSIAIFLTLLLGYFLVTSADFLAKKRALYGTTGESPEGLFDFFKKSGSAIGVLFATILVIYAVMWIFSNLSTFLGYLLTGVQYMMVFGAIAIAYKLLMPSLKDAHYRLPVFLRVIKDVILYIPCLLISLADNLAGTPKSAWVLLLIEIGFIALYFLIPQIAKLPIFSKITFGKLLLDKPHYLNEAAPLNQEVMKEVVEDSKNYHYGLSTWIYIDPQPTSTNESYTQQTDLLRFGDKARIVYDGRKPRVISVYGQDNKDEQVLIAEADFPLQRWNQVVVNYDHGTMDVFVNGELINSKGGIIPWNTYEQVFAGSENGIYGGIKKIRLTDTPLTKNQIDLLYKGGI